MSRERVTERPDQAGAPAPPESSGAKLDPQAADPPAVTVESLAAEKAEWHDRALRVTAEFQNFRKRVEKEKVELLDYASTEAIRPLLAVVDDFQRALQTESADKEYAKGMELIYQRFYDALKKLGLEPMDSQGKRFDPHLHHAIEMVQTNDAPDHTVLAEFQRGYNFKGKLLRPAMVKVAVTPEASEAGSK